jgi:hypothetical protein
MNMCLRLGIKVYVPSFQTSVSVQTAKHDGRARKGSAHTNLCNVFNLIVWTELKREKIKFAIEGEHT